MNTDLMFSSVRTEWQTPDAIFKPLDAEFHFTLDAAATPENAKCSNYFTRERDGLFQSWMGWRVWINPPYGRGITGRWVEAAATKKHEVCVMLLPARTDTRWFHRWIWDYREKCSRPGVEVRFLPGRIKFIGAAHGAPFPSMIVVFRKVEDQS